MTSDCKSFDEKLLDYLYEELESREHETLKAHLEGCERCKMEMESFGRVRSAAKSLTMAEAPQAASAKLLYQAAQLAPRRGVVIPLFKRVVHHPAYAMAASFVVVGGIAGWMLLNHKMDMPQSPIAVEAAQRQLDEEAAGTEAAKGTVAKAGAGQLAAAEGEVNLPVAVPVAAAASAASKTTVATRMETTLGTTVDGKSAGRGRMDSSGFGGKDNTKEDGAAARAPREVATKEKAASAPADKMQWHASKALDDAVDVTNAGVPSGGVPVEAPPPVVAKPAVMPATENKIGDLAKNERGVAGLRYNDQRAPGPSSQPPSGPIGQIASSGKKERPVATPPPPAKSDPPVMPRALSAYEQRELDEPAVAEGQQVMQRNMEEARRRDFDALAQQKRKGIGSKGMPQPAAPSQALATNPAQKQPARDEQAADVEVLLKRHGEQTNRQDCRSADATYRQIKEHFPERMTPQGRLDHAKCQRVLGNYSEARNELNSLLQEAPSLRGRIDRETKLLEMEEQPQRAAEAPFPAPPRAKKAAAKPSQNAKPADADTAF
ncbi:MAG: zf-HC2 domain-containing protein [Myxococcales bacterium]|nr:zf-HC2 domain-containing protein [Myxococcales bacterium]